VFFSRSGRLISFRFPSGQLAKEWYADVDYQWVAEFRRAGTRMESLEDGAWYGTEIIGLGQIPMGELFPANP
jgi:hypothetical protein